MESNDQMDPGYCRGCGLKKIDFEYHLHVQMYVCSVRYVAYTVLEDKEHEPLSSRMKRACCGRLTDYRIAQHTSFLRTVLST